MAMAHAFQTSHDMQVRQGQWTRNRLAGVRWEGLCFEISGWKIQCQPTWDSTSSVRRSPRNILISEENRSKWHLGWAAR